MPTKRIFRANKSAEPSLLIGAANATYLAKTGGGTVATLNELRTVLANGAIGIVASNNVLVLTSTTLANLANANSFQIYYKTSDGQLRITPMISRYAHWSKTAAVAAVKQNVVIGGATQAALNFPVSPTVGDHFGINVSRRTDPVDHNYPTTPYYDVWRVGDTINSALTRLIAQINADTNRIVDATAVLDTADTAGIRLTAIDFYETFGAGASGLLGNANYHDDGTTLSSARPNFGRNLYSHLKSLEEDSNVHMGRQFMGTEDQSFWWEMPSVVDEMISTKVDTATGLTLYQMTWSNSANLGNAQRPEGTKGLVSLAFVPATAVLTSIDTIASVLFLSPSDQEITGV